MLDDDDDDDDKKEDDDDNTGSARSGAPFMLTMNSSLRATRCVPPAYPPLCLPQSASGINSYVIEGMSEEEMINMAIQMSVKDQNRVQQSPHVPQVPHGPPPPQPRRRKRRAAFIKCQRQLNNMLAPQSPELPHAERRSYHNTNEDDEDDEDDDDDSRNDSDNLLSAFGRHVEPSYVPAQQQQPMRPFVTPLPPPPPPPPLQQPYQQQIFCHQSTSLFTPQQPPQLAQSSSPLMLFGPKQSSPQSGASVMPKVQQWPHQQPQQRVMWSQDTSAVFQPPQTPIFAQASFLHQRSLPQQQLFAARTPPQQQHHHQQQPPQTPLFAARTPPQQQQHHQQRLPQQRLFAARTPPQPPVQFSQGVFSTQQKFRPSVPPSGAPMFQAPLFQTSSQQQQQQQQQQRYSSMLFMNQQLSQEFRPSPTLPQYKAAPSCIQHSQQPGHSLF